MEAPDYMIISSLTTEANKLPARQAWHAPELEVLRVEKAEKTITPTETALNDFGPS